MPAPPAHSRPASAQHPAPKVRLRCPEVSGLRSALSTASARRRTARRAGEHAGQPGGMVDLQRLIPHRVGPEVGHLARPDAELSTEDVVADDQPADPSARADRGGRNSPASPGRRMLHRSPARQTATGRLSIQSTVLLPVTAGGPRRASTHGGCLVPRPERSLDPSAGPVQRLAADLRELRRNAGNPAYRELTKRCGYSTTTLSDAAGGRRLLANADCQRVRCCWSATSFDETDSLQLCRILASSHCLVDGCCPCWDPAFPCLVRQGGT